MFLVAFGLLKVADNKLKNKKEGRKERPFNVLYSLNALASLQQLTLSVE